MGDYLVARHEKTIAKYGLQRRTEAVIDRFKQFIFSRSCTVLDIGTADGQMVHLLKQNYDVKCIGLDFNFRYIKSAHRKGIPTIQANGKKLPIRDNTIDVIISAAVFKHVRGLEYLLKECHRILKPNGKMIATDPTPLGIYLGLLLGHFPKKGIIQVLNLADAKQILQENGFKVISAERFMLSPVPFTGSEALEKIFKQVHFTQLFFNQIICAERFTK